MHSIQLTGVMPVTAIVFLKGSLNTQESKANI